MGSGTLSGAAISCGRRTRPDIQHGDELLQQAEICLHGFPAMVAKSWCPRTGADVLGYVAQSKPAKLLGSLIRIVQGRPEFLRDMQKRNAEHVSSGDDDVISPMI